MEFIGYYDHKNSIHTIRLCNEDCYKRGKMYASLENGNECRCGDSFDRYGRIPDKQCAAMGCSNHKPVANGYCGGRWAMSVYITGKLILISLK